MSNSKQEILENVNDAINFLTMARTRVMEAAELLPEDSATRSALDENFRALGVERNKLKGRREQFTLELY